jgi:hypothetical protein
VGEIPDTLEGAISRKVAGAGTLPASAGLEILAASYRYDRCRKLAAIALDYAKSEIGKEE